MTERSQQGVLAADESTGDKVVKCRGCGYFGALDSFDPCYSVYNDIKCPQCGSTNNEHNSEYQAELNKAMRS